jgi:hypothetical protein
MIITYSARKDINKNQASKITCLPTCSHLILSANINHYPKELAHLSYELHKYTI